MNWVAVADAGGDGGGMFDSDDGDVMVVVL
jgi:hypothetical protein